MNVVFEKFQQSQRIGSLDKDVCFVFGIVARVKSLFFLWIN